MIKDSHDIDGINLYCELCVLLHLIHQGIKALVSFSWQ